INPPQDIPSGMWMAQRHVRGEGLDMDLFATALVLADGDLRVAILDFDLCFLSNAQAAAIRTAVETATGIPAASVLPFCSHTHAGPVILEYYRGEGEDCVRIPRAFPIWLRAQRAWQPKRSLLCASRQAPAPVTSESIG